MKHIISIFLLCFSIVLLASCGQQGPLYLPNHPDKASQHLDKEIYK